MHITNTPLLIIIRGLPGSGKTFFAEQLAHEFDKGSIVMLDPDATDYESTDYKKHVEEQVAEGVDASLHPYRFLRAQAYTAIEEGKVIIWNQPFTNLEILEKVTTRLKEHAIENNKNLSILVIEVAIDPTLAKQRIEKRIAQGGHGPSDGRFAKFVSEYTTSKPLGYTIVPINGTDNVHESVNKVVNTLQ